MNDNLYFVSIIAGALESSNVKRTLRNAFCEIKKKGVQERFSEGFKNFRLFMDVVCSHHEAVTDDHIRELIAELATGAFEGSEQEKKVLTNIICSCPQWQQEYQAVLHQMDEARLRQETLPEIAVLSEKEPPRLVSFPKGSGCHHLDNALPGNYRLELTNTGLILWDGELTAEDLVQTALGMVAGRPDILKKPTRKIDLLKNGELILRTFKGRTKGRIEIELKDRRNLK